MSHIFFFHICVITTALRILTVNAEQNGAAQTSDFCEGEVFKPFCAHDEVIVITKALYGRMRLGRCVKIDMGYIKCSSDVTTILDARCSGRRSCTANVPDLELESTRPCLELKSYLEVTYNCVKVVKMETKSCQGNKNVRLNLPEGNLASIITQETWCGTLDSPWLVEAKPGQRINISMYDFGLRANSQASNVDLRPVEFCDRYGFVREVTPTRETPFCGGRGRYKQVVLTSSNKAEIVMDSKRALGTYFIIHYQVIGCPDPEIKGDEWFTRQGDKAQIGCSDKSQPLWTLTCNKDGKWVGDVGTCTEGTAAISSFSIQEEKRFQKGTMVVIVVMTGFVAFAAFLVFFIVIRRHMKRTASEFRQPRPLPKRPIVYEHGHAGFLTKPINDSEAYMRPESDDAAPYQQVMLAPTDSYEPTSVQSEHKYTQPLSAAPPPVYESQRSYTLPQPHTADNNLDLNAETAMYGLRNGTTVYSTGRFGRASANSRKCLCPVPPVVPPVLNNNDKRAVDNKYTHVWQMPLPQIP